MLAVKFIVLRYTCIWARTFLKRDISSLRYKMSLLFLLLQTARLNVK